MRFEKTSNFETQKNQRDSSDCFLISDLLTIVQKTHNISMSYLGPSLLAAPAISITPRSQLTISPRSLPSRIVRHILYTTRHTFMYTPYVAYVHIYDVYVLYV